MNARRIKKHLKKQISTLQSDNDLMQRIIADSPKMQELYDLYNKPLNVTHATLNFQEFKVKRTIPEHMAKFEGIIEGTQQLVAEDLFKAVKENITFEIDTESESTSVTASIFIGRKRG